MKENDKKKRKWKKEERTSGRKKSLLSGGRHAERYVLKEEAQSGRASRTRRRSFGAPCFHGQASRGGRATWLRGESRRVCEGPTRRKRKKKKGGEHPERKSAFFRAVSRKKCDKETQSPTQTTSAGQTRAHAHGLTGAPLFHLQFTLTLSFAHLLLVLLIIFLDEKRGTHVREHRKHEIKLFFLLLLFEDGPHRAVRCRESASTSLLRARVCES